MTKKIGDRFKFVRGGGHYANSIWEVVSVKYQRCKCIFSIRDDMIGMEDNWLLNTRGGTWEYLGNFSKNSNFEELYNLFNE